MLFETNRHLDCSKGLSRFCPAALWETNAPVILELPVRQVGIFQPHLFHLHCVYPTISSHQLYGLAAFLCCSTYKLLVFGLGTVG